jgi:sugar-specific transcriptional regulator TrmB
LVDLLQNLENELNAKTLHFTKNEGLQYLLQLGLTRMQANIYFNLLLNGKAEARIIAYWAGSPRTEVYRALNELQENGLVDRELSCPLKFTAVPPSLGLQAFIDNKRHNITQMQKTLKDFSFEFESNQEPDPEKEYKIISIEGRNRIIAKIKQQHDAAKSSVDVISFLPRFLYIANQTQESYKKAIGRGVKYRIILGMPNESQDLPPEIKKAHNNENTIIKKVVGCRQENSAIYDQEQINFSYYPDRRILDSPLIVTNHPCLVGFALNSFQRTWDSL